MHLFPICRLTAIETCNLSAGFICYTIHKADARCDISFAADQESDVSYEMVRYFSRMRISSPGNSIFQLLLKLVRRSSHSRKKAPFWGGQQIIIPRWSMHMKHEYTIRSGLWAVIISHFHLAGQNASAWVMSIGFSWLFICPFPRCFCRAVVHRILENHY